MTTKADYTEAEWTLLLSTMAMVGFGMMAVSRSKSIGKLREMATLYRCLMTDHMPPEFRQNELVMALAEDFRSDAAATHGPPGAVEQTQATSGGAAAPRTMIACCETVALVLAVKTPAYEADGVKRWLIWIAREVARASGEGWLGAGRAISREEDELLHMISAALQIPPVPPAPTPQELGRMLNL